VAVAKEDAIYVMLYNHRASRSPEVAERVALSVRDTRFRAGEAWALDEWRIDRTHGVFAHALYEDCEKAGLAPLPNSPLYGGNPALRFGQGVHALIHANRERYADLAKVPQVQTKAPVEVADGVWRQDVVLPGHSVRLLRLARTAGR
jgi:hypothetical protein